MKDSNEIIDQKQTTSVERAVLDYVNLILASEMFNSPEELRKHILYPEWAGKASIPTAYNNDHKDFFMGFSYHLAPSRVQHNHIDSLVLDVFGLGYVTGVASDISGGKKLILDRHNITPNGLSKEVDMKYLFLIDSNSNMCTGTMIGKKGPGEFKLYKLGSEDRRTSESMIRYMLKEYYNAAVAEKVLKLCDEPQNTPGIRPEF